MTTFDLEKTYLGLSGDGEVTQMPVGPDFWATIASNPNMRGTLISVAREGATGRTGRCTQKGMRC